MHDEYMKGMWFFGAWTNLNLINSIKRWRSYPDKLIFWLYKAISPLIL